MKELLGIMMKKNRSDNKNIGELLRAKSPKKNNNNRNNPHIKKRKFRWVKIMTLSIFVIIVFTVLLVLIIDSYVERTGKSKNLSIDNVTQKYDCIIVPGARVFSNSIPSIMLQDRLDTAFKLYEKKVAPKILVSGDHGTIGYDEVNTMRTYLLNKGMPSEDIFMDHAGFDTYQTIYRAREIFGVKSAIITTQDFHLYRALYIGTKLSINVDGVDSAIRDYHNSSWNRFREYLARVKAFIECEITKPKSQYLGEKIPISGDGNQTLDDKK